MSEKSESESEPQDPAPAEGEAALPPQAGAEEPAAPAPQMAEAGAEPELHEDELVLLAVRGMTLFPGVVLPISVGRDRSVRAVQAVERDERPLGVVLQRNPELEAPGPEDLFTVGTTASILRHISTPDGGHHLIAQGERRFRILEVTSTDPILVAKVEFVTEPELDENNLPTELEAAFLALKNQASEALELLPQKPEDLDSALQGASSPIMLTDMVATFLELPADEKQTLLETIELPRRMRLVSEKLGRMIQVLKISKEIHTQTRGKMDDAQREYYLREQIKTIQTELGEGHSVEISDLAQAIEAAGMPAEAHEEAHKELSRLERMPEASMEHGMVRTYLDWLIDLPWSKHSDDAIDLAEARRILDEDHYGLEKVKKRILEFLAVRKLKPDGKSPILCLVGPPGVGKTSLGQSVARAMGREFMRISLGGVHDESEIRGHRRTYVGAMPGKIVQGLRKAGTNNPVFMLDEMDKLSASFQGDPAAALLEVLDPEQNHTFQDNYLAVPFDLSRVMFIGTANVMHAVPGALRDRLEVIELPGYTAEEKLEIAKRYLVKRRTLENGLKRRQFSLTVAALRALIRSYTREAGCRNLEREIGAIARHVATRIAAGEVERVKIDVDDLQEILGAPRYENECALRTSVAGVATGLAWTPVGGDILFVEVTRMPGKGALILTGQLGDVMKESARAAVSLVRADLELLGLAPELFVENDIHVHLPAGAIPKDGPSAGVALYAALVSLLTGRKVRSEVAMTGEISLRGLVLPVGGIKEKILAAYQAGISTVILPARNKKDLEEVPASAKAGLDFVLVENISQVLDEVLEGPRRGKGPRAKRVRKRKLRRSKRAAPKRAAKAGKTGGRRS